MADRFNGLLPGTSVDLEVVYYNSGTGALISPVSTPQIEIKDGNGIEKLALTTVGVTLISTGKYRYTYTIPVDAGAGTWIDRWVATIGSSVVDQELNFVVTTAGAIRPAELPRSNRVTITLDQSISDTNGNSLAADYVFSFTTDYFPFYTSIERIKLDIGSYISNIVDDTIERQIFEKSMEADQLNYNSGDPDTNEFFQYIIREWVTCHVEKQLLDDIRSAFISGKSKRLADLQISVSPDNASFKEAYDEILKRCNEFGLALKSGGDLGPGDRVKPKVSVKGDQDVNRPEIGRLWNPDGDVGAANTKTYFDGMRRARTTLVKNKENLAKPTQQKGVND